ncbi:hypothetical protein FB451DRAFT_235160 [Mycena latifolia]|nr:hypothetical protein FB451DRAFT_235160 [Mycena latifolia]
MTRALGDFSFKWPKMFSENLLFKLPSSDSQCCLFRHDLYCILLLFSDGVNLVKGEWVFHQDSPRSDEPATVVGALLGKTVSQCVGSVLCHSTQSRWLGEGGNMVTEVLGNLLAGIDVKNFVDTMDPTLLADRSSTMCN